MSRTWLVILACVVLQACGKKAPDEIDFGMVEKSVYRNAYLGFRLTLPADWSVQDQASQKRMAEVGGKMLAGDDKNLKAMLKASEMQTVQLVAAFKHPLGSAVRFNPSVACVAEKVGHIPGIQRGKDYHFHARRTLEAGQMKVSFPREISTEKLGGKDFDVMYAEIAVANLVVQQKYYASILRGYALACILSYTTAEDEAALNGVIRTMSF